MICRRSCDYLRRTVEPVQKRTRVLTGRANKRALVVDQSHSFIVGATVRMVAWA
jgi:hypothetical protein